MDYNSFWNTHCFTFFPYKSIREQIWPCHNTGQGYPRDIIWTHLVVLVHLMLHTKFQGHWSFVSGEEDFLRFLPYMGMVAILVMFGLTFVPPSHGGSIWNLTLIDQAVSEEEMFQECGRWTDNRRQTTDGEWRRPTYPISSPVSLRLRRANNREWGSMSPLNPKDQKI